MPSVIDYRDVTIHRNSLITLKNVSLKVKQGEFVYIIGKVGSGKSSLLKSLYADVPVASGSAHVLDYDLRSIRSRDIPYLRRQIGIQGYRLARQGGNGRACRGGAQKCRHDHQELQEAV